MRSCEYDKIILEKGNRYQVIPRSDSAHDGFAATVIDTAQPRILSRHRGFVRICECEDADHAYVIAAVLNEKFGGVR